MAGWRDKANPEYGILQVVLVYAVFAAAWIVFSDMAVGTVLGTPEYITLVSILKGWLFVAATSLLLYYLMRRLVRRVDSSPAPAVPLRRGLVGWPSWALYGMAAAASVATLLMRSEFAVSFGERPLLILLMFPVILSAALGGIGPGLLATSLVAAGIAYMAIPPVGSFAIAQPHDLIQWAFLIVNGALVSVLAELMRLSWLQTAQALAQRLGAFNLLEAIAEGSDDAIFAKDLEGRYLLFNKAAGRLVGKRPDAILGRDDRALFPADQAAMLRAIDRRVAAEGRIETNEEHLETALGPRVFLATKGPLRDGDGAIMGTFGISRDITARKRAEEGLAQSEERFRGLVEQSLVGIYIIQDGRFRYVNPGFAAIFGYDSPDEVIEAVAVLDLVCPEDRPLVAENLRRRVDGEASDIHYTFGGLRRDGSPIDIEVHGRVFEHEGRRAVIGVILDISARKSAEQALRMSELRFHDIVNASADWVWEVDASGRYTYASESVYDLLGYTAAEVLGKTPFDLMPPDEAERVGAEFAEIAASRAPFRDLDNINLRKDGSPVHVSTNGMPILDAQGNLLGYRGLDRDITGKKLDELALRESEARFRSLFDNAAVAIKVHDSVTGAIVDANRRAIESFGYATLAELQRHDRWFEPPYSRDDALAHVVAAASGAAQRFEWKTCDRHGRAFWEEVLLNRMTLNGVARVLSVTTDITMRKAAEEELRRRNDELERFNRATVGRELDMIELKRQVNALSSQLGRPQPFDLASLDDDGKELRP